MRHKLFSLFVLVGCLSQISLAQTKDMTSLFNENAVRANVKFLADDLLEGRGPGTRGGDLAAKYIASQMESLGLKGAGVNNSYFQPVSLIGVKADPNTVLTISGNDKTENFKFADEFVAFTGAQKADVSIDADTIFVGYGIDAPEQNWNDYKGNKADYRGKVLVMMVNDPPATAQEPNLFGGKALTYYGRWTYKYEQAARMGAAGVILIHTPESAGYGWQVVRTSNGSWRYDIERTAEDTTPFLQMRAWVTNDAAKRLFAAAGKDLDKLREDAKSRNFQPVNLGLRTKINIKSELKKVNSANVVGIIEGSDSKLKDEYVVYSAHYDHLGIGAPNKNGDAIYNGAVDNATGVACVLAIAEAIQKMPVKPKRSSLFLIPTAEEQGLLGAEWYAKHPIVPVEKTAADVNLDAITVLGRVKNFSALGVERSSLKSIVEEVAKERGLSLVPDARPEQGSFYRSDHFPFAKVGIPSLNMEAGDDFVGRPEGWGAQQFEIYNSQNYHQPSDEYNDSFDFSGTIQMAEISMAIGVKAANVPKLQAYNASDEFAKAQPNRK